MTGILHNILRREPPHVSEVNPKVPRAVGDLIARLLSKSPDARPSAEAALADVEKLRQPDAPAPRSPLPAPVPFWRRPVPAWLFAVTVALLIVAVSVALFTIRSRIDSTPTVMIGPDQMREFRMKRVALDEADALFEAKKYAESLAKYETYLQKYPHSTAAADGRDRARAALEAEKPPERSTTRRKKDEDISPRQLLNRLKKVFKP